MKIIITELHEIASDGNFQALKTIRLPIRDITKADAL
jgi:hypothetical protein